MRFHQVALLVAMTCAAIPATAQSLCELVPAAVVQSTLGISVTLTAAPNTQGGNGCDYKGASTGPITITADTVSDAGIYKTIFDQRLRGLGPTQQRVSGVGDAAYYDFKPRQQIGRACKLGNLHAVTGMHAHNRQYNESPGQHKQAEKYEAF